MRITRLATFVATLVVCSIALAALTPLNPSIADLTGSFRLNVRQFAQEGEQTSALDGADAAMGAEYSSFSKALKKASGAMKKLDQAFGEDEGYTTQAETAMGLMNLVTIQQLGQMANLALADDLPRSPLKYAKLIQKNTNLQLSLNSDDATSKYSRAKDRAKKLKVLAKAAKRFEKTIKRFGKNNPALQND